MKKEKELRQIIKELSLQEFYDMIDEMENRIEHKSYKNKNKNI